MAKIRMHAVMVAVVLSAGLVLSPNVFAFRGMDKHSGDAWEDTASLVLAHQAMLNLSGEQVAKIEDVDLKTRKAMIKAEADIKIMALDIQSEMKKDVIDIKEVNKLLDQKYALKKEKAKTGVGAYAAVKALLTPEQKSILKDLRDGETMPAGPMPKMGKSCPMGMSMGMGGKCAKSGKKGKMSCPMMRSPAMVDESGSPAMGK